MQSVAKENRRQGDRVELDVKLWTTNSWLEKPNSRELPFERDPALAVVADIKRMPPLVTSFEIEQLREELIAAEHGERFVLQGGDCAETLADCRADVISRKLKILLQMSTVIAHGTGRPVVQLGRIAGQYAKPRSRPTETRRDEKGRPSDLPSYFGDAINGVDFSEGSRIPDPRRMLTAYQHAAMTLNFIRSLLGSEFVDPMHLERWALSYSGSAHLNKDAQARFEEITREALRGMRFAAASRWAPPKRASEFFVSHEGLNLYYEMAQTRQVPHQEGHYCLTTHLPWIGDRTRDIDGAHIEFFRGIRNPVGVKIGPSASSEDVVELASVLNPENERGKLVFISRMGKEIEKLEPLLQVMESKKKNVLWLCDPMHGNTRVARNGKKTRSFGDILGELEATEALHSRAGSVFGGVHFELTGEDVTECTGGNFAGVAEEDLEQNYESACDPRLNYAQSLELALHIAEQGGA